jgi:hypothetical protein
MAVLFWVAHLSSDNADAFSGDTRRTCGNRNAESHQLAVVSEWSQRSRQTSIPQLCFAAFRPRALPSNLARSVPKIGLSLALTRRRVGGVAGSDDNRCHHAMS